MTIAPIVRSVTVKVAPARAFEVFTRDAGAWWPKRFSVGKQPLARAVIEPRVGGRWYEVGETGEESQWGEVLAWEPPARLLLAWRIGPDYAYDPALLTEVEITFTPTAEGGAEVRLEHRRLENFGAAAARTAEQLDGGWPTILAAFAAEAGD